ncbi:AbrB/MazE/SpoVT family DNA-binding domain-containing protein [Pelobacter propionicus]|uniref:Transcriptional regulator/antitoxin, MazE n=1 Tax=Pelobacter propionicus (strain DSM 2379 / NBRC 103807 / OttBd1) TaxID=338966 RepID=A1ARS1_PELPD|nr:AbrB/MazE/SpoVT family DNA-binding domain-containing protein [Pelobacter propionicus]ABL00042.1 transcriptional regulator/antitoxin, MazE [Pelobacter propionicus DSM 2379]
MLTHLVSIGNSKGIRIPAALLRQYDIIEEVELLPGKDEIVLRPVSRKPRNGWDEAFALMRERNEDALLTDDVLDLEEWEWS